MRHRAVPLILRSLFFSIFAVLAAACFTFSFMAYALDGPEVFLRHWPDYYRSMAQVEPRREEVWLNGLLAVEPRDSEARLRLATIAEWRGDLPLARRLSWEAANWDARYRMQWALLQFEIRHPENADVWTTARRCFQMSYGDRQVLLDAVWRLRPDGRFLLDQLIPESAPLLFAATAFLMEQGDLPAARLAFFRLIAQPYGSLSRANAGRVGTPTERAHLGLDLTDLHLDRRDPASALAIWAAMARHQLVHVDGEVGRDVVNSLFRSEPLGRGFDWRVTTSPGIEMRRTGDGWRVDFAHRPPDRVALLNQRVIVHGTLRPEVLANAPAWLRATLVDEVTGRPIEGPQRAPRVARLRIEYCRPLGQPPLREPLLIRQVRWRTS